MLVSIKIIKLLVNLICNYFGVRIMFQDRRMRHAVHISRRF